MLGLPCAQTPSRRADSRALSRLSLRKNRRLEGFTLLESMVAAVVILVSLGAMFHASTGLLGMIRSSHHVAVASAILQERMQQLQSAGWETVTDSESYTDQVWTDPEDGTSENADGLLKLPTQSAGAATLQEMTETVRVSAYRPTPVATAEPAPITATRKAGKATLTSGATNLVDEKMVRIDLRLTWIEGRARLQRSLGISAVLAPR